MDSRVHYGRKRFSVNYNMFLNNLIRGEQLGKSSSVYLFLEINKCAHALCTNDALGAQLVPVVTRYRVIYSTGDS
jgi:hypothetical protein